MNINIRKQKEEDIKEVIDLYHETWLDTYPNEEAGITIDDIKDFFKGDRSIKRIEKIKENLRDAEKYNKLYLVAEIGDKIVGVSMVIRGDSKKRNKIQTLYVLPEYQGKGVGRMLFQEANKFFDPSIETEVEADEYNKNAISFYEHVGFVDTGKREKNEILKLKSGARFIDVQMIRPAEN